MLWPSVREEREDRRQQDALTKCQLEKKERTGGSRMFRLRQLANKDDKSTGGSRVLMARQ